MNKLIIGVFGSDLHIETLRRELLGMDMAHEHMHVISAPTPVPDVPDQTRFIAEAEESAQGKLADLNVPSASAPLYVRSLRDGGSILAVEVEYIAEHRVTELMQNAGASHVAVFDTATPIRTVAREGVETVGDTSESMMNRVEKLWDDVKSSVQKALD